MGTSSDNNVGSDYDGEKVRVDGLTTSWYIDRDRPVLSDISFTVTKVLIILFVTCHFEYNECELSCKMLMRTTL